MQKKLIALAIAGLSGAAFAQSNVTVYGQVNMAYTNLSGTYQNGAAYTVGTAATQSQSSLMNKDSRLGFKGEEALGNGMNAVFTIEYGISPDQAGSNVPSNVAGSTGLNGNARQTFAGLKGNFGSFTFGRQYTPFFEAAALLDPFGVATGEVASAARINPIAAIARADNSFKYVSPMIGGNFLVAGMVGLGERGTTAVGTNGDAGKLWNWKVAYINGPIIVGLTQIKLTDQAAGLTALGATGLATFSGTNTKATAIGGTYDMKVAKLHVLNDRVKVDGVAGTLADRNDWMFGVTVPMGSSTIKAQYSKVNDTLAANNDANHIGLGYFYSLSKRTTLMAEYGKVTNKNGAAFDILGGASGGGTLGVTNAGVAQAAASYTTGYQIGLNHSF